MFTVKISKRVQKFLRKHPSIAVKFIAALDQLENNPYQTHLDIKKLLGQKNKYRLRIGKYRFLYEINNQKIYLYFYEADTRGQVY